MKPGPELDALITEKVMERKKIDYGKSYTVTREAIENVVIDRSGPSCLCGSREWCDICRPDTSPQTTPLYSTSISAAWEVVEKIKYGDFYLSYDRGRNVWNAKLVPGCLVEADTAPHAICIAALKAKGIDVDE